MIKNYFRLTKPGIIGGNAITTAGGFALASKGHFDYFLFLVTLLGISFIIASACVFNNYIDREIDEKMVRTKDRALVKGLIPVRNAIFFAIVLGLCGCCILGMYTNFLTVCIALSGFFLYVVVYGIWKRRSEYGTLIGSIAGGVPPVVGYTAVSNSFDMGAFILLMIVVLWQMPHFYAIAMYRIDDYAAAEIPVLPIERGMYTTKVHMLLYVIAFGVATCALTFCGYTGYTYLTVVALLSLAWFCLSLRGFKIDNDTLWARHMFRFSLLAITVLCVMIPVDVRM